MMELAKARLYFSVGVEMEKAWLPRIKSFNPLLQVVATDSGLEKRLVSCAAENEHSEEQKAYQGNEHEHNGEDPHIWLSPVMVKHQAEMMARALISIDSSHGDAYKKRLDIFNREVDSLQAQITGMFDKCRERKSFLVFHPSWGYFADVFSLTQIAIETKGREPGIREMGMIAERAKREKCGVLLVQPQFSRRSAEKIARHIGVTVAIADPLAENWPENLLNVAGVLCPQ
jgi:zinc transport system substrate-binding protein